MAPSVCSTRTTTRDLLYSRNLPDDLEFTKKTPTTFWKTSYDPYPSVQGVTSLVRVGHASSLKNWHSRGWRLLDQKKPTATVERRVSWKNQPRWADLTPKKETKTKKNQVRNFAKKHTRKSLPHPNPVKSFAEEHQPPPNLTQGNKNSTALMVGGHQNSTGSS